MTTLPLDVTTQQGYTLEAEHFQRDLIEGITQTLLRQEPPPCLLRAPTGSGKTFVLSRVMSQVSAERAVIWFWFVPFVNLVQQTLDSLATNAGELCPVLFADGINQEPKAGQVLVSTTQGVSRAAWREAQYHAITGEQARSPAAFAALVRANGCSIGVVVDEAHIALDKATEFGQFVAWLKPEYLALATATPKSDRINRFLQSAQMSSSVAFAVSREDVVHARLNKAYIEAAIYEVRQSIATVADLKQTVLRQAWLRNKQIKAELARAGVPLTPLLLVQVENGKGTIEDAERTLIELCGVPHGVVGKHSADTPDPGLMNAIANDERVEVLIFKQSAGTGFDAPRAFVLASTKTVVDTDFAMQFIGRVMRVHRQIRMAYDDYRKIPQLFATAYVYLANAAAQLGFQQAVQITDSVETELSGSVEKMSVRTSRDGNTVITNAPSPQGQLTPYMPLPAAGQEAGKEVATAPQNDPVAGAMGHVDAPSVTGLMPGLFDPSELAELDTLIEQPDDPRRPHPGRALSREQWESAMRARGITLYPLRRDLPEVPVALKREERPDAVDMGSIVRRCATRLTLQPAQVRNALLAVRNRLQDTERRTELTTRTVQDGAVSIVVDRRRIAHEAKIAMQRLPQCEAADQRILVETLAARIAPRLKEALEDSETVVVDAEFERMARTAAQWLVRSHIVEIEEGLHQEIAALARTVDAAPLPDVMLFPTAMALPVSPRNLYGALPPDKESLIELEKTMLLEDRELMRDGAWDFGCEGIVLRTGKFDQTHSLNDDELEFAKALDKAPFVAWWFRNPDRKGYAVRLVRGEHKNFFHPDFVVCLSHVDGAEPIQRLVETKHDLKDAARKSMHVPEFYGKVLFLTRDAGRLHVVTDDGRLGDPIDLEDLELFRETLQQSAP